PYAFLKQQLPHLHHHIRYQQPFLLNDVSVALGPWSGYNVLAQHRTACPGHRTLEFDRQLIAAIMGVGRRPEIPWQPGHLRTAAIGRLAALAAHGGRSRRTDPPGCRPPSPSPQK
ncbi:MAG: hypothetical protein PVJ55_09550, partial [Anaerolineae bacterium]